MKILAILCALTLLSTAPALAEDTCQLKELASLPVTFTPHALMVSITISGKQYHFVFGIGEPFTRIKGTIVQDMKLDAVMPLRSALTDGNGNEMLAVDVPDVKLDTMRFDIFPMITTSSLPSGVDGVLGDNVLAKFDVEVDMAGGKINLFSQDHCAGHDVYWTDEAAILPVKPESSDIFRRLFRDVGFSMQLDGKDVIGEFSTDSYFASMGQADADYLFGLNPQSPDVTPMSNGPPGYYSYVFKQLSVGELVIKDFPVVFRPQTIRESCRPAACHGAIQLSLGLKQMKLLHLFYAFSEKKLYITPADAHR